MKKFTTQEIRGLLDRVMIEEISFSEMVEILNKRVSESVSERMGYIPVRKFKKGDKVRIKEGISSKTHYRSIPSFTGEMDELIGKTMTVDRYIIGCVLCNEYGWRFLEDWLEPYEELKRGDLAIFWDSNKGLAFIGEYDYFIRDATFPHQDHRGSVWATAVKFESIEQYRKLLKGEI